MPKSALLSLLAFARRIALLANPAEILVAACEKAQELSHADGAYGAATAPGQPWERGICVCTDAASQSLSSAVRSAMFALHRRLATVRSMQTLGEQPESAAILQALSAPGRPTRAVLAFPILQRGGQVGAEIALVSERPDAFASTPRFLLDELAQLTATAMQSAHRLSSARRDQERLLILAEASEEALWDWNLTSGELWWGAGIRNLMGVGAEGAQRLPASKLELTCDGDRERVRQSLEGALASVASSWREEYEIARPDGARISVEDRAFFLRSADGKAYRVIGALRDVTALKQLLVREQQARAEAENASRAKDEFLAMLGHELRNPLAPIITSLQLMKQRGEQAAQLERAVIERQAQHLVRLVDDLLDVSRITRGLIELQMHRVELSDVVAMAVDMASPLLESRRHELTLDVAAGLTVMADPARLAQVISNLLNNAARYTEPGGRVSVRARRAGEEVELAVSDTGIGIPSEMLNTVFELFVQERQDSDRSRGGLGLGLSIVRNLVQLHGGSVEVSSPGRGRGSVFTVRLPAATASMTRKPAVRTGEALRERGRRILVVDDNQDAAELLAMYLQRVGHETRVANDGPSALTLADSFQPEVAILDIGLPVMDGHQLAVHLRERFGEELRLIAVTGYGQLSDRERGRAAGFDIHLVKPVSTEQLDEALRLLSDES